MNLKKYDKALGTDCNLGYTYFFNKRIQSLRNRNFFSTFLKLLLFKKIQQVVSLLTTPNSQFWG